MTSEGDQYLDWRLGLVFLCSSRLPEDGSAETCRSLTLVMNCILWFVFYWALSLIDKMYVSNVLRAQQNLKAGGSRLSFWLVGTRGIWSSVRRVR